VWRWRSLQPPCGSPGGGDAAPCGLVGELGGGWRHLEMMVVVEGFASGRGVVGAAGSGHGCCGDSSARPRRPAPGLLWWLSICGREGGSRRRSWGRLCCGRAWLVRRQRCGGPVRMVLLPQFPAAVSCSHSSSRCSLPSSWCSSSVFIVLPVGPVLCPLYRGSVMIDITILFYLNTY
jgi:hypothetical protein